MITNLKLPGAASLEYRDGDVRHFGPSDIVSSDNISFATRHLAYRDGLLAAKLNEVITAVNSTILQLTPIVPVTVSLVPGESLVVARFRIPTSYEAAVSSAAIAASVDAGARLTIEHNAGTYGYASGTNVVSLLAGNELSTTTSFYATGEFIMRLANISSAVADINISVIIGLRNTTTTSTY